jgi:hypothetical protein
VGGYAVLRRDGTISRFVPAAVFLTFGVGATSPARPTKENAMSTDTGEIRMSSATAGLANEQLTMLLVCLLALLGAGALLFMAG